MFQCQSIHHFVRFLYVLTLDYRVGFSCWSPWSIILTTFFDEAPRYQSYWLRCWEVRSIHQEQAAAWRFSLENPQTGDKHGFNDLKALMDYLETELKGDVKTATIDNLQEGGGS